MKKVMILYEGDMIISLAGIRQNIIVQNGQIYVSEKNYPGEIYRTKDIDPTTEEKREIK